MTLEEFRATRREVSAEEANETLGTDFIDSRVMLYDSGFIEIVPSGGYQLVILRDSWQSDNLAELERMLFDWIKEEESIP